MSHMFFAEPQQIWVGQGVSLVKLKPNEDQPLTFHALAVWNAERITWDCLRTLLSDLLEMEKAYYDQQQAEIFEQIQKHGGLN